MSLVPKARLTIVSDGTMQKNVQELIESSVEIIFLPMVGNDESFIFTLQEVARRRISDLVYFVEDDYLHLPQALERLVECSEEGFADYITLFDDPLRYHLTENVPPDLPTSNELYVSKSHHWRVIESTTFTFACNGQSIQRDLDVFSYHVLQHRINPAYVMDRESWRHLQGLGRYADEARNSRLIGAIPALSTHCESTSLAPTIDWASFAERVAVRH